MVYIHFVLLPAVSKIDQAEEAKLQGIIAKRFSIIAWSALLILLITGYLKTPSEMLFNKSTQFGIILTIKHILILCVIIFGIMIGAVVVPGLRKHLPKPGEKPAFEFFAFKKKKLEFLATTNLTLGILILICASLM